MPEPLHYTIMATEYGPLWVGYRAGRICLTRIVATAETFAEECALLGGGVPVHDATPPAAIAAAIAARLEHEAPIDLDLGARTPFQRAVLEAVAAIPRGEVRTYGEIAASVGHPGAARAVGEVMRTNCFPLLIPCHRVVRAGGDLGYYTPDPAIKRRLLRLEGAI